jgi:hypothetical protein
MRRCISPAANSLNLFLVTIRFASGIKLVRGSVARRDDHEFQASGSHHWFQHRLRQTVRQYPGSQWAHRFRDDA